MITLNINILIVAIAMPAALMFIIGFYIGWKTMQRAAVEIVKQHKCGEKHTHLT